MRKLGYKMEGSKNRFNIFKDKHSEIINLNNKGYSFKDICKQLNLNYHTGLSYIKEFNVELLDNMRNKFFSDDILQKIIELDKSGANRSEIYKLTNLTDITAIRKRCANSGYIMTDRGSDKIILTDEQIQQIVELNKQKKNLKEISKILGIYWKKLSFLIKEQNIPFIDINVKEIDDETFQLIYNDNYNNKLTIGDIVKKYEFGHDIIYREFEKRNIEPIKTHQKERGMRIKYNIDEIIELNKQGLNKKEISKKIGTNYTTLNIILKKENVTLNDNRSLHFTNEEIDRMIYLNQHEEYGIHKLMKTYKISDTTVNKIFNERGIELKKITNKKVYNNDLLTELKRRYESGESMVTLQNEFGLNKKTLKTNLIETGVKIRENTFKFTSDEITTIIDLYGKGYSVMEVGNVFNCGKEVISNLLKSNNIEVIDKNIRQFTDDEINDIIHKYVNLQLSANIIGRYYNCGNNIILDRLKKQNIEIRNDKSSLGERAIRKFIQTYIDNDAEGNNKTLISPQEIDIYSDKYKLGFEYNGLIWHSTRYPKGQTNGYHVGKNNACEDIGIKLVHIFEDELTYKEKMVLNQILSLFKINKYVPDDFDVYSLLDDELPVKELLDKKVINSNDLVHSKTNVFDLKEYITNNSLYYDNNLFDFKDLELYKVEYNNEIVSVIAFDIDKQRIDFITINDKYKINNFKSYVKNNILNNYNDIKILIDRRFNSINEYNNIIEIIEPKPYYVRGYRRYNYDLFDYDYLCNNFLNHFEDVDDSELSNEEIAYLCKFEKIFDCGYFVTNI